MGKYLKLWILLFLTSVVTLFFSISWITRIEFVNIFNEFEILLMLAGFSSTIAFIFSCTTLIYDQLSKLKS